MHPTRPGPEGPIAQLGGWEERVGKGGARLCPREGGTVPKDPDRQGQSHWRGGPAATLPWPPGKEPESHKGPWGPGDTATHSGGSQTVGPGGPQARTEATGGGDSPPILALMSNLKCEGLSCYTHICTRVLRVNTCGRDVCSEQAVYKGPHAHRGDRSQGVCLGCQREGAGPVGTHPASPRCPPCGHQDGLCPLGSGSPPRTPGGWPRRRAGGGRSSGHWEPCHHSRDMQRGSGGSSEHGRSRGGRQHWARVAAAVGMRAKHAHGDASRAGSAAPPGAPALGLPSPGTQHWRAHAPRPGETVSSSRRTAWVAATCSRTRREEGLCRRLAAPGVRVTAQGQGH